MAKGPKARHYRRFNLIGEIGCLLCKLDSNDMGVYVPCDVHHVTLNGRRLGHDYTIGVCPHKHHRCKRKGSVDGYDLQEVYEVNEDDLVELQDSLIELYKSGIVGSGFRESLKNSRYGQKHEAMKINVKSPRRAVDDI